MLSQCINSTRSSFGSLLKRLFTQSNNLLNIVGLDLGGTNSVLSMIESTKVRVIENSDGTRCTPSFITYLPGINGNSKAISKLYGNNSKKISIQNKQNTFYGFKYFFGRQYDDELIKQIKPKLNFDIIEGSNKSIEFRDQHNNKHSIQSITSDYLSYLKSQAENVVGKPIHQAIVSIPRFINQKGREELKEIMKQSGIKVIQFIDEPIAAVFGYNTHMNEKANGVLVISIGGLDSSYTFVTKQKQPKSNDDISNLFKIKNELFDFSIGGSDFNRLLTDYFTEKYKKESQIDLTKETSSMERLSSSIEYAKIELSQGGQSVINIPFIAIDNKKIPKHFNYTLSRSTFETLTDSIASKIRSNCIKIKNELKKNSNSTIDDILLVGGTTRIPKIQSIIKEVFDNKPINRSINPEEAPSQGCAVISTLIKDYLAKNTEANYIKRLPLPLGIETLGGKYTKIITKDNSLPYEVSRTLTTVIDNQPKIEIKLYLGERPIAKDNKLIGTISLNIPLAMRSCIRVQLIISMLNNGDVTVGAIETLSRKSATLSTNIIHLLNNDNKANEEVIKTKETREEDLKKVSLANLKVKADMFIYKCNIEIEKIPLDSLNSNQHHKESIKEIKEIIHKIQAILCNDNYDEIHTAYMQLKKKIAKNDLLKQKILSKKSKRK